MLDQSSELDDSVADEKVGSAVEDVYDGSMAGVVVEDGS